jgi:hypothetical protein
MKAPADNLTIAVPGPVATARLRSTFTVKSYVDLVGREHHVVTAPKRGSERRRAMHAILAVLRRAKQQQHRVSFVLTLGDYTQFELGALRGFDAAQTLLQCCAKRDPYVWFQEQLAGRRVLSGPDAIIGVEIDTWPTSDALVGYPAAR